MKPVQLWEQDSEEQTQGKELVISGEGYFSSRNLADLFCKMG